MKNKLFTEFSGANVLVTGGTGLIGRPVVDMLVNSGANVSVVSLDNIKLNKNVNYIKEDLRDINIALDVTKGKNFVIHMAGIKGSIEVTLIKPSVFFVPYLQFNTNVLEACRINNVGKVVYTSSIGAYGNVNQEVFVEGENDNLPPMDLFPGLAKRVAEKQIESYKIQYGLKNFSVVRICNCYGPGDNFDPDNAMVIPSLLSKIYNSSNNTISVWGDGSAIRDFAYSDDIAEGILLSLLIQPNVNYLNLGSGNGVTIKELVETLQKIVSFNCIWDTTKSNGFPKRVMDISLAKKLINYNPTTSLYDGLKETWNWFLDHKDEYLQRKNYFKE